ncbi:hypothetical protein SDC9_81323 [bioreactor metagenome]|uniref:Uncharacterized protein n=1 Tax=bioreactor metagenome TaxID=1076179 RepID=A0A644Z1M6_9ZZZZ
MFKPIACPTCKDEPLFFMEFYSGTYSDGAVSVHGEYEAVMQNDNRCTECCKRVMFTKSKTKLISILRWNWFCFLESILPDIQSNSRTRTR